MRWIRIGIIATGSFIVTMFFGMNAIWPFLIGSFTEILIDFIEKLDEIKGAKNARPE